MYTKPFRKKPLGRAFVATVATGAFLAGCGGSGGTHPVSHHAAASTNPAPTTTVTTTTTTRTNHKTSSLPTKTTHHKFKGCPPVCGY
jgi:ABC-type glycerol-3-phosphate transport system substrate-binding protein